MDTGKLITFALVGGAAYCAYKSGLFGGASSSTPAATTPAATPSVDLKALVTGRTDQTLLNADEWNYYYTQVRGTPGPDPTAIWPNQDRSYRMTFDEWLSGIRAKQPGFSGLRGLGRFARPRCTVQNPFDNLQPPDSSAAVPGCTGGMGRLGRWIY